MLLELDLTQPPVVLDPDDPLARLRHRGRHQLRPILRALHEAGSDRRVHGLVARVGGSLPWPLMQELRAGVRAFAASNKPTIAWAENFSEGGTADYVLATGFGEIWLQPAGSLGLLGVGAETTFLRGALDRLGIEPELEQRYEYKNAADTLLRTEFSQAHRAALSRLTESVYDDAVAAIAEARRLDPARVRELIDTGPRTAAEARADGLVDHVGYRDEVYAEARKRAGDDSLLFADRWHPRRRPSLRSRRAAHVALVEVRGVLSSGRSRRGPAGRQLGSDTTTAALRAASGDDRVGAVVLHVDSPGGAVVPSEAIWREVCRVREAGKVLVVSMGSVAASGGYYISCPADVIVALPATLTGSIGVFGGKLVVERLLDRLGVSTGAVAHGARSLMYSPRRPFSADERVRLARAIDEIYEDFVAKVAAGRHRSVPDVEAVARGRVWTGRDALEMGLVDELGGLRDAVRIARERAGLRADAPVKPALRIPPIARLGRPKNSEDPRAALVRSQLPNLTELATGLSAHLGLSPGAALLMPSVRLR